MSTSALFRWSGLACIISGLLLPITWITEVVFSAPPSILTMSMDFVAITLLALALVGIYGFQIEESGLYGFLGFLLALLMSCIGLSRITWTPEITEVSATAEILVLLMGISGLAGYILLGIGTWKANKLPRWAAALWPIGTVISALGGGLAGAGVDNAEYLHVVGMVVFGLGMIGAGAKLWTHMVEPVLQPKTAT